MSARTSTTTTHRRTTRLALGVGAVAALVAPIVLSAGPAQATLSRTGCTVTPGVPYFNGATSGLGTPLVQREVAVTCDGGRTVLTDSEMWDQDVVTREGTSPDLFISQSANSFVFPVGAARTTQTLVLSQPLPSVRPDADDVAEIFQLLRFKVTVAGGAPGPFTAQDLTQPSWISY